MSLITRVPEPNLWEQICSEHANQVLINQPNEKSLEIDYDPSAYSPVFYGRMHAQITTDDNPFNEFDPSIGHPACVGYSLLSRPESQATETTTNQPDMKKCSPREYLEQYVFPVLLPAMEEMLHTAKLEKCFERKRTKFNALDYLTEYLYKRNSRHDDREETELENIPFVKEWLKKHPRPPLPMSLIWTEEEATLIIQSHWRGYKVRCEPEIQDLRQWQREWREENENISQKVSNFWDKQMPEASDRTSSTSNEELPDTATAPSEDIQEGGGCTASAPEISTTDGRLK